MTGHRPAGRFGPRIAGRFRSAGLATAARTRGPGTGPSGGKLLLGA